LDPLVPILVVSGLNEPGLASSLLGAGADDFLSKENLAGERLLEAVRAALDRAGAVRARRRSQPDSLLTLTADLQVAATPGRFSVGTIQRLSDQLCAELEKASPGAALPRRAVLALLLRLFGSAG
jgi:DNA-binding NarL/FixJ family response regulator